jgi:hypothetical protein
MLIIYLLEIHSIRYKALDIAAIIPNTNSARSAGVDYKCGEGYIEKAIESKSVANVKLHVCTLVTTIWINSGHFFNGCSVHFKGKRFHQHIEMGLDQIA